MKKIYLAHIPLQNDSAVNAPIYLPYSVGLLWSYAQTFQSIRQTFCLGGFLFLREQHTQALSIIQDPYLVGFSCYAWNMNYSMELARQIKLQFPKCIIVAGGPHIPLEDLNFFKQHPYIDIIVYREGEISFKNLLIALACNESLDSVDGIAYNKNGDLCSTKSPERVENLDQIPSPYTSGLFDTVVDYCQKHKIVYNALIETNRGCPFQCTFCDWGAGNLGKVKKFDLRRVKKELLWMAKNKVEYITNCDANFGIFKDRDFEITKFVIRLKKRYGWPKIFDNNWHKNNNQSTVELAKMLMEAGMQRRFTSSLQSMNEATLKSIKRRNMSAEKIQQIVDFAALKGIKTQTELLIGLPDETYKSFQNAYKNIIDTGIIPSAAPVIILPNSEMGQKSYRQKYNLKTKFFNKPSTYTNEIEELIIETNTMTEPEYQRIVLWVWLVQQLHFLGYTNLVLDYLTIEKGIDFIDFYETLLNLLLEDKSFEPNKVFRPLKTHIDDGITNQLTFGAVNYDLHNRIGNYNRNSFYDGLKEILRPIIADDIILDDLIKLQNFNQADINRENFVIISTRTNLYDYIYNQQALNSKSTNYAVEHVGIDNNRYATFGEYIVQTRFSQSWKTKINRIE